MINKHRQYIFKTWFRKQGIFLEHIAVTCKTKNLLFPPCLWLKEINDYISNFQSPQEPITKTILEKFFCKHKVSKHYNFEVDPRDSVLQAPESNNSIKTQYSWQCRQNLSIIDKITLGTKQERIQQHHGIRSIELVAMTKYNTNTILKWTYHGKHS